MSISQISPGGTMVSSPPPERPSPGDLYDSERWESVYRELHSTPTLLVQLQDEVSRSRLREAFWISVIVHLLAVIAIVNSDTLAKWLPHHKVLLVTPVSPREKELTFLALPPDAEKLKRRPNSDIISDKDRIAMSRKLDPEELRKILSAPSAPPGPAAPPQSSTQKTQPATPPVVAQNPAQPQPEQPARPTPPPASHNEVARLQAPPAPKIFDSAKSASSALEQATRAAAANRGNGGGSGGDYSIGGGHAAAEIGPFDVLSDTMGVDFGPYLSRILHDVRQNWYNLIPEAARPPIMKKGKVTIEFSILKNGAVAGMRLAGPSGDVSLDRAAWGGITDSNPFPPLPVEFGGQYLALRFHFLYNPEKADLE